MATDNNLRPERPDTREEDTSPASALQLHLAADVVERLIEQNGGSERGNVFWDEDAFDSFDDTNEYVDPELWDPDADELLPEWKEIEWNLYECN